MKTLLSALVSLVFVALVNAHFQIAFPPPRGSFVAAEEPTFCDGFTNVTTNRTEFPLSGGFITLNSEHPHWSAAFYISNTTNPNSFNDFSQVNRFFQLDGEGSFCIPLDLAASNFTGLQNGQNITIQMLYDGGDGNLFQCSDITLTNNTSSISSVSCTNSTDTNSTTNSTQSGTLGVTPFSDIKHLGLLAIVLIISLIM
ncbi:hypothetical protein Ac2012v2_000175 [Leucoagaricus gongylophorus]